MKKVIIIGASYSGLYAAKKLENNKNIEVLLFDQNDYHYIQVESYGFVATKYALSDVTINIAQYIKNLNSNITFYKKRINSFNSNQNKIITSNNEEYIYDYLIIATGSFTSFPIQVPNIQKYSMGIKTLKEASDINQKFDSIINEVLWKHKKTKNKTYNIVIGGAGLSGVEVAAEMASFIQKDYSFVNMGYSKINIILIDGMKTVLPEMDKRLISSTEERLIDLNIQIHLGSFIKEVDEEKIYLTNDTIIDYDYFIFTGGIKGHTINSDKVYEVNKSNQYITDEYLHLKSEDNIFVVGDVAEVIYKGQYIAPTAQLSIKAGEYVANSIQNEIQNKPQHATNKFKPKLNGTLISLGGNYAVALLFNKFFVKGYYAHLIKKFVTKMHKNKFI